MTSHSTRRIAMISDHASPLAAPGTIDSGGQNVYVANLARELGQAGYLVDIFTRRDAAHLPPLVRWRDNVRVVHVPAGPPRYVPKEKMLPHMQDFARFVIRFALQQREMYDVVHANFFMSGMVARQIKKVLQLPYVITFHALGQVRKLAQGAADTFPEERLAIEDVLMADADRIIAECPQDCADMEELYGTPRSRIDIAPCGFDPQELWQIPMARARQHLKLAPNKFIVLQLGRMVARKGIDIVIESIDLLRNQHGVEAQLLIVGGDKAQDAAELGRLQALTAQLGLAQQVHFCGLQQRDALRYYYCAANAFVTTPWYEPFGITPVEAMACATPVIGAAVGGINSIVVDGITGYLVPPRNPQAVADRLYILQSNPNHARQMGEEGLRRAYRHYTWQAIARQIADIYDSVSRRNVNPMPRSDYVRTH
jgi:D-inositol-3-phosphate glycosyltransferase